MRALLDQGLLAPINVDFLRTWALVEMGLFGDALDNDSCKRAQQFTQRPKLATAAIAKAAWHVDLEVLFESRQFNELLRVYRDHTERRYGSVLEAYRAQDGWLADLYRAVHGLAIEDPRYCRNALTALTRGSRPPRDFIAYAGAECERGGAVASDATTQPSPEELVEAGRFDAAVEALRHQAPSVKRARLLWGCALQVDSALEVLQGWLDRFDDAERKVYHEAVPALARLRDAFVTPQTQAPAALSIPESPPAVTWLEWLDRANHGGTRHDLRDAEPSRAGFGARALLSLEGGLDEVTTKFCDCLCATRPPRMEDCVLASLPEMVGAWHGWDAPPNAKAKIADAIIYYVAVTKIVNQWPSCHIRAYADLVSERLAWSIHVAAYRYVVESIRPLVGREASRASVELAIEFAELLADSSCPDAVVREGFLSAVAGKVKSMAQKLDHATWAAFQSICRSLDLPELVLPEKLRGLADGEGPHLNGASGMSRPLLRIGAYTLEAGAGRRFKEIAEAVHGVQVVLNHDHVETSAIKELGQTDAVIVVTRCAKHAATDAIRRHVGKDRILYADGRGSSSMLRALKTYCESAGY
ncbi:MAG: hypothetical protein IT456_28145 [Planctomycetes bacterium]|nr:hypothetical protein [Planctomycetota bacterium]